MSTAREQAAAEVDAHERTIEALHDKLASLQGVDKDRLQKAVEKYKSAHQVFRDDVLGCMN